MSKKRKYINSELDTTPKDTYPKGHQIKKLSKGTVFNTTSKIIILNVYKYFRTKSYDVNVSEAVRLTVEATGCSPTSVYQLRKEESSKEGLREPCKKRKRKGVHKLSRDLKYDDTVRSAIRNIVQDLKLREVIPSLTTILEHIKNTNGMGNEQLQSMAPWTLRRLIFDLGFVYKKDGNKKILVDKQMEKKSKKPRVKKDSTRTKIVTNSIERPSTYLQSHTIPNTTFNCPQMIEKNEYMLYEPNNMLIQLHHQVQLPQENNLLVDMPNSIISSTIQHGNIDSNNDSTNILSGPKLMVLTSHSTLPWS